MKHNGNGPVIGLDMDGTLGEYHGHFLQFAQGWTGREMPLPREINPGLPLYKHMGVSKPTYRRIKLAYRQGGLKRSMPVYGGASEMTRALRKEGHRCEIVICTSRPYNQLGGIDIDTRHWLLRNGIQYDHIIWGENKYRDLHRQYGDRVAGVLDDLPTMCSQAIGLGIPTAIMDQPYNKIDRPEGVRVARDLDDAEEILESMLQNWRVRNASC